MNFIRLLLVILPMLMMPMEGATLTFVNTTNGGLTFNYTGSVENNQQINPGDYLVIFDFEGLVSGAGPADWTFSMQTDVAGQADDATLPDATFTYTGASILGVPGGTSLGTFSLTGTYTAQATSSFFMQSTRSSGGNAGQPVLETGAIIVADNASAVPEPSAVLLMAGGLLFLGVTSARIPRRRSV
jgi:hypothetical protein